MKKFIPGQVPVAISNISTHARCFQAWNRIAFFSFLLCWLFAGSAFGMTANKSNKALYTAGEVVSKSRAEKSKRNRLWYTQVQIMSFSAANHSQTANLGDIVTLSYTSNVPLPTNIVTIAGHTIVPTLVNSFMGTDFYSASYKMWGTDAAGNIPFTLDVIDNNNQEIKFNNQGTLPPFYTPVNFINPPLTLDVGDFSSTYIPNSNLAHIGDRISLSWQTNFAVQSQNIVIAGHSPDQVQNVSTNTYQAFYSMLATDTVTKIRFEVDVTDIWGHTASATMSRFGISYITFNTTPAVTVTGALAALSTTFGTASASTSVAIAGYNLTNGLLVTAPAGFEVSADNVNFATSVTVPAYASYLLHNAAVYARLAASTPAGTYSGDVVLSAPGLTDVHVPTASSVVHPAATITSISPAGSNPTNASTVNYTVKLTDTLSGLTTNNFSLTTTGISGASVNSVTGTGDTYTVAVNTGTGSGTLTLNLANGAGLTLSITNTLPFSGDTYTIDKTPPTVSGLNVSTNSAVFNTAHIGDAVTVLFTASEAVQAPSVLIAGHTATVTNTGGNAYSAQYVFLTGDANTAINYNISLMDLAGNTKSTSILTIFSFDNTPTITNTDTISALSTGSGTASIAKMFNLTAYNIGVGGVAISAPAGFELSADNATFSSTININASGTITATPVYVRLAAADGVGPYSGNIVLTSAGATTANVVLQNCNVLSSDASLSNITLSTGYLKHPNFAGNTYNYASFVGAAITSVTVTPASTDPDAIILVNGNAVNSGSASQPVNLNFGANLITIDVTAPDGVTKLTYTDTLYRALSTNSNLLKLVSSRGVLTPGFSNSVFNYTKSVVYGVSSITFTPTTVDANTIVTVGGSVTTSGTASVPQALNFGDNVIDVVVTAQDGSSKIFAITVTRAKSTNDNLFRLTSNLGVLTKAALPGTGYSKSVNHGFTSITFTPTTVDPNATVTVGGNPTISGVASVAIPLNVGDNFINVVVTAQDGITNQTYTVTVNRAMNVLSGVYQEVGVEKPDESLHLAEDNIKVHQGVSPNGDGVNDFLWIDGIATHPENTLSIMDRNGRLIYEVKGYDNSTKVFDGHSNKTGVMQSPGTYFYSINYAVKGELKHQTGYILLKY